MLFNLEISLLLKNIILLACIACSQGKSNRTNHPKNKVFKSNNANINEFEQITTEETPSITLQCCELCKNKLVWHVQI